MHKIRVYVDTSVFGGTQEARFSRESILFFQKVMAGEYVVLLSTETLRELKRAPETVQAVWKSLDPDCVEIIKTDDEIEDLAQRYITAEVLGEASASDALHVAAATVTSADLILSWNFKHIVNFKRIRGFNGVNIGLGYRPMTILSPTEVVGYETRE